MTPRLRRRNARGQRNRSLMFENLESRQLLAGDLVQVSLQLADINTQAPLQQVNQGDPFLILVQVEDQRDDPQGVFAAYVDVLFDDDELRIPDRPLVYEAPYQNGRSGAIETGLIDEVGAFAGATPTGGGLKTVVGIPFVADVAGELTITSDPADDLPFHDVLLYGSDLPASQDAISYGGITFTVVESQSVDLDAFDDTFDVAAGANNFSFFDVLKNDVVNPRGDLSIKSLDLTNTTGVVELFQGQPIYRPAAGFVGVDRFSYTASANGQEDTAVVSVNVIEETSDDELVALTLDITDPNGNPIDTIAAGQEFILHAFSEDLRADAKGVFAAYLDVSYSSDLVEIAGDVTYGESYLNGRSGDTSTPGELDEAGAFAGISELGGGPKLVFSAPFVAIGSGDARFEAGDADLTPAHDMLVYGVNEAIPEGDIRYGMTSIEVLPTIYAIDDTFHVETSGGVAELPVLANDIREVPGAWTIVDLVTNGLTGTAQVSANGLTVQYDPGTDPVGSEQFHYVVEGPQGRATGLVTVHNQPLSGDDDVLAISLQTTDLNGNPVSSVTAGEEFLVTVHAEDLRDVEDAGVFAAYFDLLYDAGSLSPVRSDGTFGIDVAFGANYPNGTNADASLPGIINEFGAFQQGNDPLGGEPLLLASAKFRANDAVGHGDSFTVTEDADGVSLNVLANDVVNEGNVLFKADPSDDLPGREVLIFEPPNPIGISGIRYTQSEVAIVGGGSASVGSVSTSREGGQIDIANEGQALIYTPPLDFFGSDLFTYTIGDSAPITVEVLVEGVNDAPVANSDGYRVREGEILEVGLLGGVLANDIDVDGDSLTLVPGAEPQNGDLTLRADGSFVYVPDAGFVGEDSFTYTATDGELGSNSGTVTISVAPPPVSIRLEAVDLDGQPISQVGRGQRFRLNAQVQDLRDDPTLTRKGVGAVYLDIGFDDGLFSLPNGISRGDFGPDYQNGVGGTIEQGLLNDIGAFQTSLDPLGDDELNLFSLLVETAAPIAIDDDFTITSNTNVNKLGIFDNESTVRSEALWDVESPNNSPLADILFYDPPAVVPNEDIRFVDASVEVTNGNALTITGVSETDGGGTVTILDGGTDLSYTPADGFSGPDSFTYTFENEHGATGTATVSLDVVISWQNEHDNTDINGDGERSPLDVLLIVALINTQGSHELAEQVTGDAFFDSNGDGFVTPLDVLLAVSGVMGTLVESEGEADTTLDVAEDSTAVVALDGRASAPAPLAARSLPTAASASDQVFQHVGISSGSSRGERDRTLASSVADDEDDVLLDALARDVDSWWTE